MTPEQQRIAIAKACGYTEDERNTGKHGAKEKGWWIRSRFCLGDNCLPQYLHDLNAMHEAEKTLNQNLAADYARMVTSIAWQSEQPTFAPMTATAAQRAEAFLRTIGKWATLTQTEPK
jgi:uncharacterized protein